MLEKIYQPVKLIEGKEKLLLLYSTFCNCTSVTNGCIYLTVSSRSRLQENVIGLKILPSQVKSSPMQHHLKHNSPLFLTLQHGTISFKYNNDEFNSINNDSFITRKSQSPPVNPKLCSV